jgi:hypothetical protein
MAMQCNASQGNETQLAGQKGFETILTQGQQFISRVEVKYQIARISGISFS